MEIKKSVGSFKENGMGEEKKELVFRYGAYWDERCIPLCDVCYLSLVPGTEIHYAPVDFVSKANCPEYAYCHNCGKSKMLYTDSGKSITIKEAIWKQNRNVRKRKQEQ